MASQKLQDTLAPVVEQVARQALGICARQLNSPALRATWQYPERGYRKAVLQQIAQLVRNRKLVQKMNKNMADKVAKMVAELIVQDRLLDKPKRKRRRSANIDVVPFVSADGLRFLEGTSIKTIRDERAGEQSKRDKLANVPASLALRRATVAQHPSAHHRRHDDKEAVA